MFITELFESEERNLVVVYAGRFQPFHKGHKSVYDYLLKHYGRDQVFIATSNKIDPPKSPFNYSEKCYFMQMMGIPMDRVVESSQPYKATELTSKYPAENTVFLIAVSQKDMAEDPRFKVGTKKDGNPTYFQNLPTDLKQAASMDKHGYLVVVPTFDFKVMGQPMRSATEIRAAYGEADEATRREIIQDLFGAYTQEAQHIMDLRLGGKNEGLLDPGSDSTASPISGANVKPLGENLDEADVLAFTHNKQTPPDYEQALKLMKSFLSFDENTPDYGKHMNAILSQLNSLGYGVQSTIDPSHDGLDLVNKKFNFRQFFPYKLHECSGYIPKNSKEAKDPRWSRALSVDVHTDTMKKELKNFFPTKAPKTQQTQVTESLYVQGYTVNYDQPTKTMTISKGNKVITQKKVNVGSALNIKSKALAIIDQLEYDKYPDNLNVRPNTEKDKINLSRVSDVIPEEREPYQKAIDDLEWARIERLRADIDWWTEQARRSDNPVLITSYMNKIQKMKDEIASYYKIR